MGNSLILKEGKAFNLGDGKFSGIPKFRFSGFQYFEMMASLGNFETLGEIDASQNGNYEK